MATPIHLAGHPVHPIGYGLMGLTWRASPPSQTQAFAAMRAALDSGANFWNGGEIYGNAARNSLHLLAEYFTKHPEDVEKVVVCIKGGCVYDGMMPDGSSEGTRRSIQECVDVLGKAGKKLDLWESARVDPKTPIEITMREAKAFIERGELGGVCLSECSADTIRRAAKVVKVAAVEVEFSLWETEVTKNGVADACKELGIPIVAYSPLGRGFLTGALRSHKDIPEDDHRKHFPRFSEENFPKNLKLLEQVEAIAKKKGCTPGQIGISWILAKSGKGGLPEMLPIPGATTEERVRENMVKVDLNESEMKEIDALVENADIVGDRYGGPVNAFNFGNSPPLKE
ncbi:hypothetical protein LTR48_000412 [Friedmanniomyces endolithicus]|uniref:NADP-dependent oxidoreductase domain-containing protein n=1 Tax=Rachicladosporium monterosium TaxID=1507873 RepID=A0ABR0LIR5_9PEZI|nr:hypothetical protein LTR94_007843 [Friedmanniomyces endolithicus]KAK0793121.1 hypothetical protein LTR59_008290 [Friedmanniomyces endolithicus]KAK1094423.1 hypothetical protein LTR48_000412 [Friedmanniomyces endolithicus]KAK5148506.1 hypothetical protein LTR32_000233 [Rachicladosporium monterosium]